MISKIGKMCWIKYNSSIKSSTAQFETFAFFFFLHLTPTPPIKDALWLTLFRCQSEFQWAAVHCKTCDYFTRVRRRIRRVRPRNNTTTGSNHRVAELIVVGGEGRGGRVAMCRLLSWKVSLYAIRADDNRTIIIYCYTHAGDSKSL